MFSITASFLRVGIQGPSRMDLGLETIPSGVGTCRARGFAGTVAGLPQAAGYPPPLLFSSSCSLSVCSILVPTPCR
eukprot:8503570-Pyramimonas_sp.AAC.1